MSAHRNVNKLVVVKKYAETSYSIDQVLRADLESNNKGALTLLADGRLILTAWVNKKVSSKVIQDVSDACWQCGGESEVVIACQNGMLVRYSVHFDTGLSCSLQLSAPSLLSLIREKDSSIRSVRNPRIWGHTQYFILLQPQSDRLALLATNAGGCPTAQGVLRTPPLRTAHLYQNNVLAQPVTGTDLYEYEANTCKLIGIISLGLQRMGSEFIEWGSLACSSTGDTIALADSERHLYVTNFRHRASLGKKGGVSRTRVTLHQVIWPTNFQPSRIAELSLGLSDTLLTVFCQIVDGDIETQNYLSFDVGLSSLVCHHCFAEQTAIIPGVTHHLPDLFLISDGVAMLMDEDASISSLDSEVDLGELLGSLSEGLEEQNMAKVTEVKAIIEQGLSVFLASCNHQDGWIGLAEMRAKQYGQLSDLLLSYIPRYAQQEESHSTALSLKYLAKHHFSTILEEMNNVLQYIDSESVSQMVLQMSEQVSFYLRSVEQLQLPQAGTESLDLTRQHAVWGDKPVKEIIEDALANRCVKSAEAYLQLKPWVYGTVVTTSIIDTCIDVARESLPKDLQLEVMLNIDDDYNEVLRQVLYSSDDLFEVDIIGRVLGTRDLLSVVESLAVKLVVTIHRTLPDLLTLPPKRWTELVSLGDASSAVVSAPVTVGQVTHWTPLAMMLVITDLYAYTADAEILETVDADVMWQYLLYQHDLKNLKRWIFKEFHGQEIDLNDSEFIQSEELIWVDPKFRSPRGLQVGSFISEKHSIDRNEKKENTLESKFAGLSLLSGPLYPSDVESSVQSYDSLDSSSQMLDDDSWSVQSFEAYDCRDSLWSGELFKPITQYMIDLIVIAKEPFVELLLNILARSGVFMTSEKKKAELLMKRLLVSGALELIADFNGNHTCQVSGSYIHTVIMEFFGAHDLVLPAYDYVKNFSSDAFEGKALENMGLPSWVSMIVPFTKLLKTKGEEALYDLSLKNLAVLSETCQNPSELQFPVFLTMLFAPTKKLQDFFEYDVNNEPDVEDQEMYSLWSILAKHNMSPKQVADGVVMKLPYLQKMFPKSESNTSLDVTMYDLLSGTISFDMSRIFTFQKKNRYGYDENAELISINDEEMMKKHGIQHSLGYLYYLHEGRPTYACAAILASIHVNKKKKISQSFDELKNKVYGFALSNWPNRTVCSASISLLLMMGMEVDHLRIVLASAFLIYPIRSAWCLKLAVEKRKGHELIIETEIGNILQQLCINENRAEAAAALLEMLENCVILSVANRVINARGTYGPNELLESGLSLNSVVDMMGNIFPETIPQKHIHMLIEGMRLCVELSVIYKLPWPVKILTKLTESNQWLLFLVIVQVFNCPKTEVLKVVDSFQSIALREHMMLALTHMYYYREAHQSRERRTATGHSRRSALYTKIGIHSREGSKSPVLSGDERRSPSPSEGEMSIIDDVLSFTTTETSLDVGIDAWLSYEPKDLYSILLTCHHRENPASELVTAGLILSTPVLSVFAGCYERHNPSICLSVWLYTKLSLKGKCTLHHQLPINEIHRTNVSGNLENEAGDHLRRNCCRSCDICVLQSGLEEQKLFILFHVSYGSLDVLIEGFKIFDPNSPILFLLLTLQEVKGMCNQDKITQLLSDSASAMSEKTQLEQNAGFFNREWITRTTLDIIGTALDDSITNSHLQYQLLTSLTAVSQLPPFCSHFVDWTLVSQLCKAVGAVKHQISFRELLWSFGNGELKENVNKVVTCLSSKRCFNEALQVCQLIKLPVFTIVCAQLRAEFEKSKTDIIANCSLFEEFLCKCQKKLYQESVQPEHAAAFFIAISRELASSALQYLCLQYAVMWSYKRTDCGGCDIPVSFVSNLVLSHELQITEGSHLFLLNLEYGMWQAYVQSLSFKETGFSNLSITPPSDLGHWPWEGENGLSSLDLGLVMKSAGLSDSFLNDNLEEEHILPSAYVKEKMDNVEKSAKKESIDLDDFRQSLENIIPSKDMFCGTPDQEKAATKMLQCEEICSEEPDKEKMQSKEVMDELPCSEKENVTDNHDEQRKQQAIQALVNLCVKSGLLISACRILRFFRARSKNVQSLLLMLSVADGRKAESDGVERDVSDSQRTAVCSNLAREHTLSRSTTGSSYSSFCLMSLEEDHGKQTTALSKIASGMTVGRKTAERIIIMYKVAALLDLSYIYLVHHPNPITLVSLVLRLKRIGVIQLARDLSYALPVPQNAILSFLCEEAVATITAGPDMPGNSQRDRLLLWDELEVHWRDLVSLCEDPSSLGYQLLDIGQRMGSSHPDQVEKVHSMSVELVIRAHDCFTAASSMEGIGTVLRTALSLTTSLMQHSQWSLMVRLLIGVGRYSEMSYIIDALRERDQFEQLLGRASDPRGRETGLDRALLHYLRSKYPEDTDTLRLVALHFLLYSEVAEMWVADAKKAVEQVLEATVDLGISCSTTSTVSSSTRSGPSKVYVQRETTSKILSRSSPVSGTHDISPSAQFNGTYEPEYLYNADSKLLIQAMHSFAHAAQYYMQDQQLVTAVEYSRQAELVALQTAYVRKSTSGSALRLLKLTPEAINYVTTRLLRVCEAQLVARAYSCTVDWGVALYQQYVKKGDESYLTEYLATFKLAPEVMLDVVKKLEHDGITRDRRARVASMLVYVEESDIVYRVASQLGLKGTIDTCLVSAFTPYLRDTVFVKGFTSNDITG
ncbi:spatacsin [Panulirus ornatus]|uniref:spatacsin n=1 Tax=Panulirus ornatus TaxID=150431 RepID=UPI003A8B6FF4